MMMMMTLVLLKPAACGYNIGDLAEFRLMTSLLTNIAMLYDHINLHIFFDGIFMLNEVQAGNTVSPLLAIVVRHCSWTLSGSLLFSVVPYSPRLTRH